MMNNNSDSKLVQDLRKKKQSEPKEENKLLADLKEKKSDINTEHLLSNCNMSISELNKLLDSEKTKTKQFLSSLVSNPKK